MRYFGFRYVHPNEYHDYYSRKWDIALELDKLVYRSPNLTKNHKTIGLLLLIVNILLLILMWYEPVSHFYPYLRAHFTPETYAVVKSSEPVVYYEITSGANKGVKFYNYNLNCEYTIGGNTYYITIPEYTENVEPGEIMTIHYNANNPSDSFFVPKYRSTGYPVNIVAVLSVFNILFFIMTIRYMLWGRFQTEKNYFYYHDKLPKPKPHNYTSDNKLIEDNEAFDFYTSEAANPGYDSRTSSTFYQTDNSFGMDSSSDGSAYGPGNSVSSYGGSTTSDPFDYGQNYASEDTFNSDPDYGKDDPFSYDQSYAESDTFNSYGRRKTDDSFSSGSSYRSSDPYDSNNSSASVNRRGF